VWQEAAFEESIMKENPDESEKIQEFHLEQDEEAVDNQLEVEEEEEDDSFREDDVKEAYEPEQDIREHYEGDEGVEELAQDEELGIGEYIYDDDVSGELDEHEVSYGQQPEDESDELDLVPTNNEVLDEDSYMEVFSPIKVSINRKRSLVEAEPDPTAPTPDLTQKRMRFIDAAPRRRGRN